MNRRYSRRPQRQRRRSRCYTGRRRTGRSKPTIARRRCGRRARTPAVPFHRRRRLRAAVRQDGKPFLNNGGVAGDDPRRLADRRHVRVPARRAARLGQPLLQRRPDDIAKNNPEIALQRDGTIDPTKTWFNTDAGFERDAGQAAGELPETRLPVPHRRRARAWHVPGEHEHRPELRPGRPAACSSSAWTCRTCSTAVLGQPEPRPDEHRTSARSSTATNSIMRFFTFVAKVSF